MDKVRVIVSHESGVPRRFLCFEFPLITKFYKKVLKKYR